MSDGTLNQPVRTTHPPAPTVGRVIRYIFDNGAGEVQPYYMLSDGIPQPIKTVVDVESQVRSILDRTDVENTGLQSTTSLTPVVRSFFTKTFNYTDEYVLDCDFIWNHSSASSSIIVELVIDGSVVKSILIEPKDPNIIQRRDGYLRYRFNETAGSMKVITLQFNANSGGTSRIYESNIRVERNLKL